MTDNRTDRPEARESFKLNVETRHVALEVPVMSDAPYRFERGEFGKVQAGMRPDRHAERNRQIIACYRSGARKADIAREFGLSDTMIAHIIQRQENRERIAAGKAHSDGLPTEQWLDQPATMLGLSVRTTHCFINSRLSSMREVMALTERDLLNIPNFGRRSLQEIKDALAARGLRLAPAPKRLD